MMMLDQTTCLRAHSAPTVTAFRCCMLTAHATTVLLFFLKGPPDCEIELRGTPAVQARVGLGRPGAVCALENTTNVRSEGGYQ
jgi:hypothetical protein